MYVIKMFDGLLVPEYIQRGDAQDIGTGASLTNFLQLPGGGFYDNYRDRVSPQGIRPLNKSGVFWGTHDELQAELDAWRGKLGKRGRLTIEFDNDDLRWQWARLQDVSAPRPSNAKGGWLPFSLTWITAAQNWRGIVRTDPGWTWGDESWVWGDGSAEMGESAQTFDVATSGTIATVTHDGGIDASNVTLRFEMTGVWEDLTIVNRTTGQQITIARSVAAATPWLEINAGARSIYTGGAEMPISTISRTFNILTVTTTAAHSIESSDSGQTVRITGNALYDGTYNSAWNTDATHFQIFEIDPYLRAYGSAAGGAVRELTEIYDFTTFSDRARWLVLAPGENELEVTWNDAPDTAEMAVEFADHYA